MGTVHYSCGRQTFTDPFAFPEGIVLRAEFGTIFMLLPPPNFMKCVSTDSLLFGEIRFASVQCCRRGLPIYSRLPIRDPARRLPIIDAGVRPFPPSPPLTLEFPTAFAIQDFPSLVAVVIARAFRPLSFGDTSGYFF